MKLLLSLAVAFALAAPSLAQKFEEIHPMDFNVNAGTVFGGDLFSLYKADGNYLVLGSLQKSKKYVQMEIVGYAPISKPAPAAGFWLGSRLYKSTSNVSKIVQQIELYNFRTGNWDMAQTSGLGFFDVHVNFEFKSWYYVSPKDNEMRARITWFSANPISKDDDWLVAVDRSAWVFGSFK